uniref:precorrin-2 C(20)-methyltransferase n=1 Tax=Eubacterium cellulosolvens TaxID=29322 RepID=UPI00048939D6|nr:precorrin-2 C(20)-methyltransferase [[Eubacterium] cellulosolvens]
MNNKERGRLYGIGVGPGDPELITVKALKRIRQTEVIALPGTSARETTAYKIAVQICPELAGKTLLPLDFPMTKDRVKLRKAHEEAARLVLSHLDEGRDVAFLTLGDPTVYSTYLYLHRLILESGREAEIISGVPSFCAAAATLGCSLAERDEMIHILPGEADGKLLNSLVGTRVLMKAGRKMADVLDNLSEKDEVSIVENCGFPDQRIYREGRETDATTGYFTLAIIKRKEETP